MLAWLLLPAVIPLALFFFFPYLIQDVHYVLAKLKLTRRLIKYKQNNYTILDRFLDVVKTQPNKPFVYFNDETFTYKDADELSNKAARVFLQNKVVTEGDTVALFDRNEPMFLWLWLGLVKIGCSVAFLNYNIRSKSLLHCLNCSGAKTLVAGAELQAAVEEVLPNLLEQQVTVFILADSCKTAGMETFKDKMSRTSSEPLPKNLRSHLTLQTPAAYIYTSGTTGTTFALRSKFSASQFWDDCRRYNITVILYIGEIMRYLCSTPKKINDKSHKVRLAIGNGIRADVWRDFIIRFGNVHIREFYGATDGNFSLINYSNKVGAVGRENFLNKKLFPYALIKYDIDKGGPIRDSSGLCIEAAKGEPGLLVTEITLRTPFPGYLGDLQQTEKKMLHNVFKKGDLYVNTGDQLRVDIDNFVYFQDRVGDTFRWKGENVATTEVTDVISLADCIKEANVYGVKVPGQEGRVGMAAVVLRDGQMFDSVEVFKHVENFLPVYARPRFLRIQSSLDITGTFKHLKVKLMEEGFNPNQIPDPLYFLSEKEKNYVPLTLEIFNSLITGKITI
ncbi:Very long-chain acyl-CoA synthetase [Channa argus]|uniref:long-chain-fatty-acid--CoA ligase n=1 Tax=Channa argus TaxID=215402 RepID=A0A6G1PEN7_CHAAH|nr:Very long-chain acyl-CoA synthetase [Channa argus]